MEVNFNEKDLRGLRSAISRNPQMVLNETRKFLQRGIAAYMRTIDSNPWRIGGTGGGSPIATGNLRASHKPPIYGTWEARIEPNRTGVAPYAPYVHEGTYKMESRPWLDYTQEINRNTINTLSDQLLINITNDLAR